jgi:hypothetical protein
VGGGRTHAALTRVTNKWGRTSVGPGGQRRGAGAGGGMSMSERVGTALTSGAGGTVCPIRF